MKSTFGLVVTALKSIPARVVSTTVMVVGIAGVVGVLTGIGGLQQGLETAVSNTGRTDRAVILSEGASTIGRSSLTRDHLLAIEQAKTDAGSPLVGRVLQLSVALKGIVDDGLHAVVVRGLSPAALQMRPEIQLTEGRMFASGRFEAIVGKRARDRFEETTVGDVLRLDNAMLTVVGVFESDDWFESGFVTDADTLASIYGRTDVNAVTVALESSDTLVALRAALDAHLLEFEVIPESDYYARLAGSMGGLLEAVSKIVSIILAIGGSICAMNVMFTAISDREVEMATVRAIGFAGRSVIAAVLAESLVVALVGAAIGTGAAWLLLAGDSFVTGNANLSVVNRIQISPAVFLNGGLWAIGMSLLGAFLPAWIGARKPIVSALRPL